ncbi:MAG: cation:proton antiporter, partial [Chloroflexi bacterium]|nr:cation:proton antiporter [Chloroflexota bacterium]
MTDFLQFLLAIIIIVSVAKTAGYLSTRLGQPAVLGQLVAGVLLGPTVLNLIHTPIFTDVHLGETISLLAELGVIFLMFVTGLEVDLGQLRHSGKVSALAGTLGVVFSGTDGLGKRGPLRISDGGRAILGFDTCRDTSVSISAQTLLDLRVLRSREGVSLLGAVVFDDILVILLLSIFVAVITGTGGATGMAGVAWVVLRMGLYLGIFTLLGLRFIPALIERVAGLPISRSLIAFTIVVTLLYAWSAEVMGGMAAIIGAFLAGLLFKRSHFSEQIGDGMHTLAFSLFVPIFFINIGLEVNARELSAGSGQFVVLICIVAVLSKILGSGLGARLGGFNTRQSLRLGVGG